VAAVAAAAEQVANQLLPRKNLRPMESAEVNSHEEEKCAPLLSCKWLFFRFARRRRRQRDHQPGSLQPCLGGALCVHNFLQSWLQLSFNVSFVPSGRERTALVIVSIVGSISILANMISFCCYCCSCKLRRRGCCWTLCTWLCLWCRGLRRRLRRHSVHTVDTEMQAVGQGTVQQQQPLLQEQQQPQQPEQQSQMQRDLELVRQQQREQWQQQEDLRQQLREQQQQQRELEREREVRELRRLNKSQQDQLEMQLLTVKTLMDVKGLKTEPTTTASDNPFL
jgi:hypothetical protein